MSLAKIANTVGKRLLDNSPVILTAIGVAGTVATAVLASRASIRAVEVIRANKQAQADNDDVVIESPDQVHWRLQDKLKVVWPLYVPAVSTGAATITCIILANRIGTKRAAALASAYMVLQEATDEYRAKVIDRLGEGKERALRDELAQEKFEKNQPPAAQVVFSGRGKSMTYDQWTGRYFESTYEDLKKAQNDLNYKILHGPYASLNDFYNLIGLPTIPEGDEVGWNSDKLMDLYLTATLTDNMEPAISVDFQVKPIRNYQMFH